MSIWRTAAMAALSLTLAQAASADPIIFSQGWDGAAVINASQNDTTPGGFGNFATMYDDFRFGTGQVITDVHWTGGFFNPGQVGAISSFKISFYADNAGQPGASLYAATIAGNANQTSLGSVGSFPFASYSVDLTTAFNAAANTRYWVSIVPDMAFPPQWGLGTTNAGNGSAFQDFLGTRGAIADMAFELSGHAATTVPTPGSLPLVALALFGLLAMRRKSTQV